MNRRADAFEHDLMLAELQPAFAARSMEIREVCWNARDVDWGRFDAAIIGTTWDYWDRREEFLDTLTQVARRTRLFNPLDQVRWNIDKRYLNKLEREGASTIPSVWLESVDVASLERAFDELGCDELVVKRQIGANAEGQHRIARGDKIPEMTEAMLVQAFQPTIESEGEYSFIFIDGSASHALNKRPSGGDYRIQSSYGGLEFDYRPSDPEWSAAQRIVDLLDEPPLYARVDMIRGPSHGLLLMEIELIEPYLYPEQATNLGAMLAEAVAGRLEV